MRGDDVRVMHEIAVAEWKFEQDWNSIFDTSRGASVKDSVLFVSLASGAAEGIQRSAKALSASLRAGESAGGKWLRPVGSVSRRVGPLAKASPFLLIAAYAIDVTGGDSKARAFTKVAAGAGGSIIGGAVCALGGPESAGGTILVCPALVVGGGLTGEKLGTFVFDQLAGKQKRRPVVTTSYRGSH